MLVDQNHFIFTNVNIELVDIWMYAR